MKTSRTFIFELFLIIVIKFLFEYSYVEFVVPVFGYAGFIYEFSPNKYIFGWFIYILGYILLLRKKEIYIFEVYLLLFLLYVLPNTVYYGLSNQETNYYLAIVLPFFIIVYATVNRRFLKYKSLKNGKIKIILISFALVLLVLLHYFFSTGGRFVLNFSQVYDFRSEFEQISSGGLFGYLNNWVMKIFTALIFAWAISIKKMNMILLSFFFILLLFMLSGHKSALTSIFLVLFFYYLFKVKNRNLFIIFTFLSLMSGIVFITLYFDSIMLGSMMIRRSFFIPAYLNFTYFEFFSQNDFILWSNSIFKYFIDYPYNLSATHVIGNYLGKPDMGANTGFAASGFMHAGYFGVVIYTSIGIMIMNLINQLAMKTNKYIVLSIIFFPINTFFISSDLFTTLLTHGLIIAIIVLWLYQDKEYKLRIGKYIYRI